MEKISTTPIPSQETERLADLHELQMLDTPPEEPFDGIAEIAAALFDVPYAAVTLVDADRQWFKSNVRVPFSETSRDLAFCSHTIMSTETLVVEDFTLDPRFMDHPFVAGEPKLRFYAGASLVSERRQCVGTVCILDLKPRALTPEQRRLLERLARQAMEAFETRKMIHRINDILASARL